jgi:hypothetical protein
MIAPVGIVNKQTDVMRNDRQATRDKQWRIESVNKQTDRLNEMVR